MFKEDFPTNCRSIGNIYETKASEYLKTNGYQILEQNYHCRYGEIDLIAKAPDQTIVFIEVKARSSKQFGYAADALTPAKCQKIRKTSWTYIRKNRLNWNRMYRYDVILFQNEHLEHIVNAFY